MKIPNFLRADPARKFDILYSVVAKTGLIMHSGGMHPSTFRWKKVVDEYADGLHSFEDDLWEEYMSANLPLLLHNSIYAETFPVDDELTEILERSELKLQRKKDMPWISLAYEAGRLGKVIDFEALGEALDEVTAIAMGSSRSVYEDMMKTILENIMIWCRKNRAHLDLWHKTEKSAF